MKRLLFLALAAAPFACTPATDQPGPSNPDARESCRASQLDAMIGMRVYDQTITVPGGAIRNLAEGEVQDSTGKPTRINVVIDDEGRILRGFCG